jgi:hypothetical protein
MTIQAQLRAALEAKPFRPFVICLEDGQRVPVTKPQAVGFVRDDKIAVADLGHMSLWAIELARVTGLEVGKRK